MRTDEVNDACKLLASRAIHHLDEGRSLSLADTLEHIDDGTLLTWLGEALDDQYIRLYTDRLADLGAEALDRIQRTKNAYRPAKAGIANNGIALIASYLVASMGDD